MSEAGPGGAFPASGITQLPTPEPYPIIIPAHNRFYGFMRLLIAGINRLYFRLETIGADNLPAEGGVLLVANHASNLDPTTVASGLKRQLHFLAKKELFEGLLGKFLRKVNAHPLNRSGIDRTALKVSREILRQGHVLLVFPEGQRTTTGLLLDPKPGAALFAAQTDVPLVPAYISGSMEAMPLGSRCIRRHKLKVFIGKPFRLEHRDVLTMPKKDFYNQAGQLMMEKIAELEAAARSHN